MPFQCRIITLFLVILLSACGAEEKSKDYLLSHPYVLKHEIEQCQDRINSNQSAYCVMVLSAAAEFSAIEEDYQSDPSRFGFKVIAAEVDAAKAKQTLENAQAALATLTAKKAPATEITRGEATLTAAHKTYAEKAILVKEMLTVIGLTSPE